MITIGFIGLGAMGGHMVRHMLAAGFEVHVNDLDHAAVAAAVRLGARAAETPAQLANAVDAVFVCLPTPPVVESVALGERGIIEGRRAKIYVDLSTTGPSVAQKVARRLAEHGIVSLDAPLAGGVAGAEAGTLSVMVSGGKDAFEATRPAFESFGRNVVHVGDGVGQGQALKLINNMIVGANLICATEAILFGVRMGLDAAVILDMLNKSTARSFVTEDLLGKRIVDGKFDFGFRLELMRKDLRLCVAEAEDAGAPMFVNALVKQFFERALAFDGEGQDMTVVVKSIEEDAGATIRRSNSAS